MRTTKTIHLALCSAAVLAATLFTTQFQSVAAAGPDTSSAGGYRVLKPIETGDLTLFPVVRSDGKAPQGSQFLTLDEGLRSGAVEVTEAGKVRGLVRSRTDDLVARATPRYQGDQVNTLVLVNNSSHPLLLLAGEIVTGGKQDRIIAKDRIVPPGADPIDLSVFCVEHGRWTESSAKFGAATSGAASAGFMVQPAVRQQAMVTQSQQQVWDSVDGAITSMARAAAAPRPAAPPRPPVPGVPAIAPNHPAFPPPMDGRILSGSAALGTTSYAKAMQNRAVSDKVDQETASLAPSRDQPREQALATLRQEHAVGVVVAVHGEIIWADLFSDPELLARYWTKLVRSYAAEGLTSGSAHRSATLADAQSFLDAPSHGREDSEGEVGIYRYREVKTPATDLFALESLLPGTNFDVHISKLKIKSTNARTVYPIP